MLPSLLLFLTTATLSKVLFDGRMQGYKSLDEMSTPQKYEMHIFKMRKGGDSTEKELKINASPKEKPINDKASITMTMDEKSIFKPNVNPQGISPILRSDLVHVFDDTPPPSSGLIAHFATVNAINGFKNDKVFQMIFMEAEGNKLFQIQVENKGSKSQLQFAVDGETNVVYKAPFKSKVNNNFMVLTDIDKKTVSLYSSTGQDALKLLSKPTATKTMGLKEFHAGMLIYKEGGASLDAGKETLEYSGIQILGFKDQKEADSFVKTLGSKEGGAADDDTERPAAAADDGK